jgi:CRISPR-associated protein Cas2
MYVLVTYDVPARRTGKYRKLLARYLRHEQNSVFGGNLAGSDHARLRSDLRALAEPGDRIVEITAENRHNLSVATLVKDPGNGTLREEEHDHHRRDSDIL